MNLLHQREMWRESFDKGYQPPLLKTYRDNRNSECWRTTKLVEELCEYILYLEEKEEEREEDVLQR